MSTKNKPPALSNKERYATDPVYREKVLQQNRLWYQNNKEHRKQYSRDRQITESDHVRAVANARYTPEKGHRNKLKFGYGLTPSDYQRMLADQHSVCDICSTATAGGGRQYFSVVHDHETGRVRGLLCSRCNRALGLFGDSIHRLANAIAYLRKPR